MTFDDQSAVDKEVTSRCDIAREKYKKIDANAKQQKKEVIKELARSLDGLIPTDTIAIEIKNQFKGEISVRYIDECLDKKYKQRHRHLNACKQKKSNEPDNLAGPESTNEDDLAVLTPLKSESKKKEEAISADSSGQLVIHKDSDEDDFEEEENYEKHDINDYENSDTPSSAPLNEIIANKLLEVKDEVIQETESIEEPSQLTQSLGCLEKDAKFDNQKDDILTLKQKIAEYEQVIKQYEQLKTADRIMTEYNHSEKKSSKGKSPFKVNILYRDLREKMVEIFKVENDNGQITISGETDLETGKSRLLYYGSSKDYSDD
jgi:hypothetical protein